MDIDEKQCCFLHQTRHGGGFAQGNDHVIEINDQQGVGNASLKLRRDI